MSVVFDASSFGGADFSSSATVSHTMGTGTNGALFVAVAGGVAGSTTITGVTYNGVAMTLAFNSNRESIYVLVNPPSGAHNIVASSSTNASINIFGLSYFFVDQTNPVSSGGTNSVANNFATSASLAVTVPSGGAAFSLMALADAITVTEVAGQTVIAKNQDNGGGYRASAAYKSGSGSTSIGWTWDATQHNLVQIIVAINPDSAPVVTPVTFSGTVPTRNGVVGTAASFANASYFSGSATPFVYSNVGAALPAGLTLSSSTGIISGTPTVAGTTTGVIVRATDTASNTANTNSYSIVIAASGTMTTITSPSQGGKFVANGAQRASVACNVTALDKTTHAVLERKTGLTSSTTGVVSYASTVLTAGTERLFLVKADADDKDIGLFFATPV